MLGVGNEIGVASYPDGQICGGGVHQRRLGARRPDVDAAIGRAARPANATPITGPKPEAGSATGASALARQ